MPQDSSRPSLPDVKHLLTAAGLVAGTLGTLLLGAALQVDPQTVASEPAAAIATLPLAGGSLAPPDPAPAPAKPVGEQVPSAAKRGAVRVTSAAASSATSLTAPVEAPPSSRPALADRAEDPRRMLSSGNEWTLQFMVTCNTDSASRLLQDVGDDPRLFMLPLTLNDRPCFRVCWDSFRSRDRALAHGDIPGPLREINAEPIARKVADVIP